MGEDHVGHILDAQPRSLQVVHDLARTWHEIRARAHVEQNDILTVLIERQVTLGRDLIGCHVEPLEHLDHFVLWQGAKGKVTGQHQVSVAHRGQIRPAQGNLSQGRPGK